MVIDAKKSGEQTLEFLLGFNGHVHHYAGGYWLKFEITKVEASDGKRMGWTIRLPCTGQTTGG